MSTYSGGISGYKRRRVNRACDGCRQRKVRCDGDQRPAVRCTGCAVNDIDCTYADPAPRREVSKGYVQILEDKVRALERFLQHLLPGKELAEELNKFMHSSAFLSPQMTDDSPFALPIPKTSSTESTPKNTGKLDEEYMTTFDKMIRLSIQVRETDSMAASVRYFGTSSTAMLVVKAMETRSLANKLASRPTPTPCLRTELWRNEPWEWEAGEIPYPSPLVFPPIEDMTRWVGKYFEEVNMYLPVIHWPTFKRLLFDEQLHLRDEAFASTVLVICAIGEKRAGDGPQDIQTHKLKGWAWFNQVHCQRLSYLALPGLFDLQRYALSAIFLGLSWNTHACWNLLGVGIRMATDIGAHRKWKNITATHDAEYESYKRVMWVLVCMDRWISVALGRPLALHDDDLDIDLPVECDDEWWNHPDHNKAWKQPQGSPSKLAFLNSFISLTQLQSRCIHTMYTLNKNIKDMAAEKREETVSELDSSLNEWFDSIPAHLRWDSDESSSKDQNQDRSFYGQSAFLHAHYHYLQILIHRPIMVNPGSAPRLDSEIQGRGIPSLTICTNAARRISRILSLFSEHTLSTSGDEAWLPPLTEAILFAAGVVLMFGVWIEGKRKNLEDVKRCMDVISALEKRHRTFGKGWDVLRDLTSDYHETVSDMQEGQDREEQVQGYVNNYMSDDFFGLSTGPYTFPMEEGIDSLADLFSTNEQWGAWDGMEDWSDVIGGYTENFGLPHSYGG